MMYYGPFEFVILSILLAIFIASALGILYLWYRVYKGEASGGLPVCAKCGYAVRGLTGLDCPECGADLREVGIITPKQRGAVSPMMFFLLWTLLLPVPSCPIAGLLLWVGPQTTVQGDWLRLMPIASGEYQWIIINPYLSVEGNSAQHSMLDEHLEIDPVAMTYEDRSSAAIVTKPLDRQVILDMFKRVNADITRQDVLDEADELLSIIRGISTQGLARLTPIHFNQSYHRNSYQEPAGWFMLVLLGLWVVFWIGGFWLYIRICRKNQSNQPPSPGPAPPSQPTG